MEESSYECFCNESFGSREDLVSHNVEAHEMSQEDSQRAVDEKYPMAA